MTVEAESSDFFRSSTFELDGEGASRLHEIVLKALPAGRYRIRVSIAGAEDAGAERGGTFTVCHPGGGVQRDACDPASGLTGPPPRSSR